MYEESLDPEPGVDCLIQESKWSMNPYLCVAYEIQQYVESISPCAVYGLI